MVNFIMIFGRVENIGDPGGNHCRMDPMSRNKKKYETAIVERRRVTGF